MKKLIAAIKIRILNFKMRYRWQYCLMLIRDGMDVQIDHAECSRDWYKRKGDMKTVHDQEIILRVLNYWRKEVDDVLNGHIPGT